MGVFDAMTTAVSGLRAQALALENVSGNVANARTTGFKRADTSFLDMVAEGTGARASAGPVEARTKNVVSLAGDLSASSSATNLAIDGRGWFAVDAGSGPGTETLYTRRGDFELDRAGRLVNGAGHVLRGRSLDPSTGATTGTEGALTISRASMAAKATATVSYAANLPANPRPAAYDAAVPGSGLLTPASYAADPRAAGSGVVSGADAGTFVAQSLPGGVATLRDASGAPVDLEVRWAKTADASAGGPDTWEAFYLADGAATGGAAAWRNLGAAFTFDPAGNLTSPAAVAVAAPTVAGSALAPFSFSTGAGGLTQRADAGGAVRVEAVDQDGYAAGELTGVEASADGRIVGVYGNGRTAALAEVGLVRFASEDGLARRDGGAFAATGESGAALRGLASGSLAGGTLEGSNADIAEEFAKMIVTQQAYGANARVVTTAQRMLQAVIDVVR